MKQLIDNYGLSRVNADWIVSVWCVCFGENVLGKECEIKLQGKDAGPAIQEEKPATQKYGDLFRYRKSSQGEGLGVCGFVGSKNQKIHYIDKAVNLEIKTVRQYGHVGRSTPGLLKGNRWNVGVAKPIESTELVQHRGILYVTNQRIVFQASEWGFDKSYRYLTAINPYTDACELQFGNKTYNMIVADGNLLYQTLQLIKKRRAIY